MSQETLSQVIDHTQASAAFCERLRRCPKRPLTDYDLTPAKRAALCHGAPTDPQALFSLSDEELTAMAGGAGRGGITGDV